MIKVLVYNEPTKDIYSEYIDFNFENFTYKNCQDLIETCLKNGKTVEIFSISDEEKEQK